MKGVQFNIRGEFAHFRNPYTISFFETLLAPPKTTIAGILGAAMGLDEKETIEFTKKIRAGIKIRKIAGFMKELTTFYNLKSKKEPTKTPILREVIVKPEYTIYIGSEDDDLVDQIISALKAPEHPLYLGISDYIAQHDSITEVEFSEIENDSFECVIPYSKDIKYIPENINLKPGAFYIAPKVYRTVLEYKYSPKGRIPVRFIDLIMFYGYTLKLSKAMRAFKTSKGEVVYLI